MDENMELFGEEGFDDIGEIPVGAQKEILVVPIIDASGSMSDYGNITKVNEAMATVPAQLKQIEQKEHVKVVLAPLAFSNEAKWLGLQGGSPVYVDQFVWRDLSASGGTNLGDAYTKLWEKLTTKEQGGWMDGRKGLKPILLLISDGAPNPGWERPFEKLKERGWFSTSIRYAIKVESAREDVLLAFTENKEAIYDISTLRDKLSSLIVKIIMKVTEAVSKGGGVKANIGGSNQSMDQQANKEIIAGANEEIKADDPTLF